MAIRIAHECACKRTESPLWCVKEFVGLHGHFRLFILKRPKFSPTFPRVAYCLVAILMLTCTRMSTMLTCHVNWPARAGIYPLAMEFGYKRGRCWMNGDIFLCMKKCRWDERRAVGAILIFCIVIIFIFLSNRSIHLSYICHVFSILTYFQIPSSLVFFFASLHFYL